MADEQWDVLEAAINGVSGSVPVPGLCTLLASKRTRSARGTVGALVSGCLDGLEDGEALTAVILKAAEEALSQLGEEAAVKWKVLLTSVIREA